MSRSPPLFPPMSIIAVDLLDSTTSPAISRPGVLGALTGSREKSPAERDGRADEELYLPAEAKKAAASGGGSGGKDAKKK